MDPTIRSMLCNESGWNYAIGMIARNIEPEKVCEFANRKSKVRSGLIVVIIFGVAKTSFYSC